MIFFSNKPKQIRGDPKYEMLFALFDRVLMLAKTQNGMLEHHEKQVSLLLKRLYERKFDKRRFREKIFNKVQQMLQKHENSTPIRMQTSVAEDDADSITFNYNDI